MPRIEVRGGTGGTRLIELPEGMSPDQMAEAIKKLPPETPIPAAQEIKSPFTPARDPRVEEIAKGLQGGGIGPSASWAVPGGPLAQIPIQGAVRGAEALMEGRGLKGAGVEALRGATGAAGGAALGKALPAINKVAGRPFSALGLPGYAAKIEENVANLLKKEVPAWGDMKSLKDMLFSQRGFNKLHRMYDDSLKSVVSSAGERTVPMLLDDAKALGFKDIVNQYGKQVRKMTPSGRGFEPPAVVDVPAGQLAEKATGFWKTDKGVYRRAVKALDDANLGDPAVRKAYKTAMGATDYFKGTNAITPQGKLDVMKAQAGTVGKKADPLLRRDLGEIMDLLTPGGKALTKGSLAPQLGTLGGLAGAASGFEGGHMAGPLGGLAGAPVGAAIGGHYGMRMGSHIPTYNLPPGPGMNFLQQLAPRLGGAVAPDVVSS